MKRLLAALILLCFAGCTKTWTAQSRVDPLTVAASYGTEEFRVSHAKQKPQHAVKTSAQPDSDDSQQQPTTLVYQSCAPEQLKRDTHSGVVNLDCYTFPGEIEQKTAYQKALASSLDRNKLVAVLVKQSDNMCTAELGTLNAHEAEVNTGLSVLTTALSATSTLLGGQQAKSILSALATTASGTRDHINVHIYRNQIAQSVSKAIETERSSLLDKIESSKKIDYRVWTIDDAIRDVDNYHRQCSFIRDWNLFYYL